MLPTAHFAPAGDYTSIRPIFSKVSCHMQQIRLLPSGACVTNQSLNLETYPVWI